jgi:hypothetical protein
MTRYRISLEHAHYASSTINLRLAAVRRLAYEAADAGLLSPDLAAGIRRVKGAKRHGIRVGNWLTAEQGRVLGCVANSAIGTRVIRNVLINRLYLRAFQRFGSATKPPENHICNTSDKIGEASDIRTDEGWSTASSTCRQGAGPSESGCRRSQATQASTKRTLASANCCEDRPKPSERYPGKTEDTTESPG